MKSDDNQEKIWKFFENFQIFKILKNEKKIQKNYFEYEFFQRNLFSRVLKIF